MDDDREDVRAATVAMRAEAIDVYEIEIPPGDGATMVRLILYAKPPPGRAPLRWDLPGGPCVVARVFRGTAQPASLPSVRTRPAH